MMSVVAMHQVAITTRVIELVHEILTKRIHTTKRDLFYCDPKLFVDQVGAHVALGGFIFRGLFAGPVGMALLACACGGRSLWVRRRATRSSTTSRAWPAAPERPFTSWRRKRYGTTSATFGLRSGSTACIRCSGRRRKSRERLLLIVVVVVGGGNGGIAPCCCCRFRRRLRRC